MHKYTVEAFTGSGSYGSVYVVKDKNNGERKAMKACKYMIDNVCEIDVMMRVGCDSRYVIGTDEWYFSIPCDNPSMLGYITYDLFIVMPLASYNAREWMKINYSNRIDIAWSVLCGVRYLASMGIMHLDLTLSNVLIGGDVGVRVADLGMVGYGDARYGDHMVCMVSNTVFGRDLRPPEECKRSSSEDRLRTIGMPQVIYSLGKIFNSLFRDLSDNTDASDLVAKMTQEEPSERIALADIISHPIFAKNECTYAHSDVVRHHPIHNKCKVEIKNIRAITNALLDVCATNNNSVEVFFLSYCIYRRLHGRSEKPVTSAYIIACNILWQVESSTEYVCDEEDTVSTTDNVVKEAIQTLLQSGNPIYIPNVFTSCVSTLQLLQRHKLLYDPDYDSIDFAKMVADTQFKESDIKYDSKYIPAKEYARLLSHDI